jgi:zinc transport system permease protein
MTDWGLIFSSALIQNMFICTAVCCILAAVVGTFVVVRRIVFVTGGIAHTTFGGVGMAFYLQSNFMMMWFEPMLGAAIFAISAAVIMASPKVSRMLREDSVIGVLWSVGMALGVIFMHYVDTSVVTPSSYEAVLFGSMVFLTKSDVCLMAAVTALILVLVALLFRDMQLTTFDETQATLSGINVTAMNMILYIMVAVTCVLMASLIGIIMIIALITIPPAIANMFCNDLKEMMISATVISLSLSMLALLISIATDLPPGATVAIVLGVAFITAIAVRSVSGRIAAGKAAA